MKVSHNWLQDYFKNKLPEPDLIANALTMNAYEVVSVEALLDDHVYDIDVLPNRAHDSLSHRGIAREISAILKLELKNTLSSSTNEEIISKFKLEVKKDSSCVRYIGRVIEGVKIEPSPKWLKERLEVLGQKSINNIVDAVNYIMLDIGQPMHAFDKKNISGNTIVVRNALKGEKLITLDKVVIELNSNDLIIADDKEVLAIAGVKGGKKTEVNNSTTSIIIESANFEPKSVRKTSNRIGIRTDSSKRFENGLTPELAKEAIERVSDLIISFSKKGEVRVGPIVEYYPKIMPKVFVGFAMESVEKLLGLKLTIEAVEEITGRLSLKLRRLNPLEDIAKNAQNLKGVPYVYGASVSFDAPRSFDCSSYVAYLYRQVGIQIPRISVDQYAFGKPLSSSEILPGDVIFANTGKGKIHYETKEFMKGTIISEGIDHCGIYLGDGLVAHTSKGVVVEKLEDCEQFSKICGYRRFIPTGGEWLVVEIPKERLDLTCGQDIIEEIGRIYGYREIKSQIPKIGTISPKVNIQIAIFNKIRNVLTSNGFSEVYTYAFSKSGAIQVENPIASDKGYLRSNLSDAIEESLKHNANYVELLGIEDIKIFEIGNVFNKEEEYTSFAFGVKQIGKLGDKDEDAAVNAFNILANMLGLSIKEVSDFFEKRTLSDGGFIFETKIDENNFVRSIGQTNVWITKDDRNFKYIPFSVYPFVLRDISIFVPRGVSSEVAESIISNTASEILAKITLFDVFEKENDDDTSVTSYAYHLVFQSYERTLSDNEVNKIMEQITKKLEENKGWNVR